MFVICLSGPQFVPFQNEEIGSVHPRSFIQHSLILKPDKPKNKTQLHEKPDTNRKEYEAMKESFSLIHRLALSNSPRDTPVEEGMSVIFSILSFQVAKIPVADYMFAK
jgi:hypothetical protein